MEDLNHRALISLHPRRFGKSLFVSLLNQYYDIQNKNRLGQLFEGCWIAEHRTPNAASFLVLPLDFSNLDTLDFGSFQRDFNAKNNTALNTFLSKYESELGVMELPPKDEDFVQNLRNLMEKVLTRNYKVVFAQLLSKLLVICDH